MGGVRLEALSDKKIITLTQKLRSVVLDRDVGIFDTDLRAERCHGMYDPVGKTISLCSFDKSHYGSFSSIAFARLCTLAHEFGHHLALERSKRLGFRELNSKNIADALVEERRAWEHGAAALKKVGMKGKGAWEAYWLQASSSLMCYADDLFDQWRVARRLVKARCECGSKRLVVVVKTMSKRLTTIVCRQCGRYTLPRTSVEAVLRNHIRDNKVTGSIRPRVASPWILMAAETTRRSERGYV